MESGWRKPQSVDDEKAQFLKYWAAATWDDGNARSGEAEWARRNPVTTQASDTITVGDQQMSVEDFRKLAKARGWKDPTEVKLDKISQQTRGGSGAQAGSQYRMDGEEGRLSTVTRNDYQYGNTETSDDTPIRGREWVVDAGEVKGQKRHTRVKYGYDDKGNFIGVNFDADEKGLEGAAPLLAMAGMALGFAPGGFSSIGAGVNSTLGLGLAPGWNAALGGATFGGASAAITGQDPIKGAVMGAITPAVKALNPGTGLLGLSGNAAMAANLGIGTGIKAAVSRKKPSPINTAISLAAGWR